MTPRRRAKSLAPFPFVRPRIPASAKEASCSRRSEPLIFSPGRRRRQRLRLRRRDTPEEASPPRRGVGRAAAIACWHGEANSGARPRSVRRADRARPAAAGAAGRAHAPAEPGGVRRADAPGRTRTPAARDDRRRAPSLAHPVGSAGQRQDDPRPSRRPLDQVALRPFLRRPLRRPRAARGDRRGGARAAGARPPHHPLRRRDPPLQQGPAGRLPALRRERHRHPDRRHHREPVLRGHRAPPVARLRARPAAAGDRRGGDAPAAGAGRARARPGRARPRRRARRRSSSSPATRAATRGWG